MSFIINPYSFGSTFDPLSLSPALWLSDTGSDASVWPDLSGNGRNATQATTANQPAIISGAQNGRQVRRFDGSNDFLSFSSSGLPSGASARTAFTVLKRGVKTSGLAWLYGGGTANSVYAHICTSTIIGLSRFNNEIQTSSSAGFSLLTSIEYGSSAEAFVNGSSIGTGSSAGTSGGSTFDVGRYGFYNAEYCDNDIAEILLYPTALTTTNRQAVESYLRTKWGTP